MPSGGHNIKPVEQRLREGNPGRRPLPQPLLVAGRPELEELREPPAELNKDARAWWGEYVPVLASAGLLDRADRGALVVTAQHYGDMVGYRRVLNAQGHFGLGSTGQIKEHAAVKMFRDASAAYMRCCNELGLTPLARTRLGLAQLHGKALAREMEDALDAGSEEIADAELVDDVAVPGL